MKLSKTLDFLLLAFFLLSNPHVQAKIRLDNDFSAIIGNSGSLESSIDALENTNRMNLLKDVGSDFLRKKSINYFHMTFNGENYYIAPTHHQSKEENERIAYAVKNKLDLPTLPGGGICSLFIYNEKLNRVANYPISLREADGRVYCNGIKAVATASQPDALLMTVTYYLTDQERAKTRDQIGQNWRQMTVLLHLSKDNGRITVTQDDTCFGNPNSLRTIVLAKRALQQCGVSQ